MTSLEPLTPCRGPARAVPCRDDALVEPGRLCASCQRIAEARAKGGNPESIASRMRRLAHKQRAEAEKRAERQGVPARPRKDRPPNE